MKKTLIAVLAALFAGCIHTPGGGGGGGPAGEVAALVVGVENGFAGRCDGALKDAGDMAALLKARGCSVVMLVDKAATAAAVQAAMKKAAQADLAVIYFSGHGGSQPTADSFEVDGRDEYICCYDKGMLDDSIWEVVQSAKGRVFLMFDCCHSETMFRSPGITFSAAKGALKARGSSPRMLCWSGCPDSSYSYGSSSGGEFTTALRLYAEKGRSYSAVWKDVSSDKRLKAHQSVRSTKIGGFDEDAEIFR